MFIFNMNFMVGEDRKQLGTVTVTKKGELKVSPNIVKTLSDEELAKLSKSALDAFSILVSGMLNQDMFRFSFVKRYDRTSVIYSCMGNDRCIGHILDKNRHLNFESDVSHCIRCMVLQELNSQKIRYKYNGKYHN